MPSAIDPTQPAASAALASAPMRSNFQHAHDEITALQAPGTGLVSTGTGATGLALTVPVAIANGGTGAVTAPAALTALGAAPLAGATFAGKVNTVLSAAASAGLNLPHGAAPTTPVNGDLWTTAAGLYAQINGAPVGPYSTGGTGSGTVVSSALNTVPYYTAAASVTGNAAVTMSAAGLVVLNQNAAAPLAPAIAGTPLQIIGSDSAGNPNFEMVGFGGSSGFIVRKAGGTGGSPAATPNGANFINIQGRGYDTAWTGGQAGITLTAAELWSGTGHGTQIGFQTTPVGSLVMQGAMAIGGAGGGLTVGTPSATQPSPVVGDINCQRLFVNGSAIVPGAAADTTNPSAISAGGTNQGTATALTYQFNVVTTVGAGSGVVLPAGTVGGHVLVRNSGANPLLVYPAGTAQINTLAASAPITVPVNSTAYFECQSAAQWFTVP